MSLDALSWWEFAAFDGVLLIVPDVDGERAYDLEAAWSHALCCLADQLSGWWADDVLAAHGAL